MLIHTYLVDTAGVSATFLMTGPIASDLKIKVSNEAWILGTYSMIFAATRGSGLSFDREMLTFHQYFLLDVSPTCTLRIAFIPLVSLASPSST